MVGLRQFLPSLSCDKKQEATAAICPFKTLVKDKEEIQEANMNEHK